MAEWLLAFLLPLWIICLIIHVPYLLSWSSNKFFDEFPVVCSFLGTTIWCIAIPILLAWDNARDEERDKLSRCAESKFAASIDTTTLFDEL